MENLRAGGRPYLAADFSKPFTFSSRMKTGTLDSLDIGPERKQRLNWHMGTDLPPTTLGPCSICLVNLTLKYRKQNSLCSPIMVVLVIRVIKRVTCW